MNYTCILLENESISSPSLKEKIKLIVQSSYYFLKNLFFSISSFIGDIASSTTSFFKNILNKISNFVENFSTNKGEKFLVGLCCGIFISAFSYIDNPYTTIIYIFSFILSIAVPFFTDVKKIINKWNKIRKGKKVIYPFSILILITGIIIGEIIFADSVKKNAKKSNDLITFSVIKLIFIFTAFNFLFIYKKVMFFFARKKAYSLKKLSRSRVNYLKRHAFCIFKAIELINSKYKENEISIDDVYVSIIHYPNLINFAIFPERVNGKIYLYIMDDLNKNFSRYFLNEEITAIFLHEFGHLIFKKATSKISKFIFNFSSFYFIINFISFYVFNFLSPTFIHVNVILFIIEKIINSINSIREEIEVDIFSMLNYPTLHLHNALKKLAKIIEKNQNEHTSIKTIPFFKNFATHPEINMRLKYLREVYTIIKKHKKQLAYIKNKNSI